VAKRLGISYDVLDNHDGELMPTLEVRIQIIRKIREWNADVVIAPRPNDYHPDHRYTGVLVQDGAYMVAVPNIAPETPALKKNPVYLYSSDPFIRPNPFRPVIAIDISSVFDKKISALDAHESQVYEWLPWIGGYISEVPAGKKERFQWLTDRMTIPVKFELRKSLEKWYGKEKAATIKHAEAFEICEYGKRPDEQEIRRLFPMLRN
jgi:LmbE family N-acetylglucosaminyl deacetylase